MGDFLIQNQVPWCSVMSRPLEEVLSLEIALKFWFHDLPYSFGSLSNVYMIYIFQSLNTLFLHFLWVWSIWKYDNHGDIIMNHHDCHMKHKIERSNNWSWFDIDVQSNMTTTWRGWLLQTAGYWHVLPWRTARNDWAALDSWSNPPGPGLLPLPPTVGEVPPSPRRLLVVHLEAPRSKTSATGICHVNAGLN